MYSHDKWRVFRNCGHDMTKYLPAWIQTSHGHNSFCVQCSLVGICLRTILWFTYGKAIWWKQTHRRLNDSSSVQKVYNQYMNNNDNVFVKSRMYPRHDHNQCLMVTRHLRTNFMQLNYRYMIHRMQGLFCVCAKSIRDGVTVSLAGRIHRMIPGMKSDFLPRVFRSLGIHNWKL